MAAAVGLALLAGGCGPVSSAALANNAAPALARSTLVVAVSSNFPTLDPTQARDTESVSAIQLLDEPLFTYNKAGQVEGLLASRWTWSGGGTVLTVQINPAATFADGKPVLASDVVFSLSRLVARSTNSPHASVLSDLQGYEQLRAGQAAPGLQATGARTVVFRLQRPITYLPEILAMPCAAVVEAQAVSAGGASQSQWWLQHSVGSGPYELSTSVPGTSLLLKPNPHYWRQGVQTSGGPEGPFAPVEFRIVSQAGEQAQLFDAGQIDVLAPADTAAFSGGLPPAGSRLLEQGNEGLAFLGFNTTTAPFNNPVLRQVVAYAINMQALTAAAGSGAPAAGLVPPGVPSYDAALQPNPYDPKKARALFAESGASVGLPITLLTIAASGTVQQGVSDSATSVIAQDLNAVGFAVTVRSDTWQQYYRDLAAGRENLFEGTWLADYPDPHDFVASLLGPGAPGQGSAGFTGTKYLQAMALVHAAKDAAARVAAYERVQQAVLQEVPILPEFYTQSTVLLQPWVHPASFSVFLRAPLMPQLDRVWLQGTGTASGTSGGTSGG